MYTFGQCQQFITGRRFEFLLKHDDQHLQKLKALIKFGADCEKQFVPTDRLVSYFYVPSNLLSNSGKTITQMLLRFINEAQAKLDQGDCWPGCEPGVRKNLKVARTIVSDLNIRDAHAIVKHCNAMNDVTMPWSANTAMVSRAGLFNDDTSNGLASLLWPNRLDVLKCLGDCRNFDHVLLHIDYYRKQDLHRPRDSPSSSPSQPKPLQTISGKRKRDGSDLGPDGHTSGER